MVALVFGEADPKDYLDPYCVCGHLRAEHEKDGRKEACWHGWGDEANEVDAELGCECPDFVKDPHR